MTAIPSLDREAVARVIDGDAWSDPPLWKEETNEHYRNSALAKADAILALLPPLPTGCAEGWVMVPNVPTPQMVAAAAVAPVSADPTPEDWEIGLSALDYLPPSEHPDVGDILAELVRDYRAMIQAAPQPPQDAGG